jgi:hypothetical protein
VLAQQEIAELRAANEAAARRKPHKRKRVKTERTLTVEEGLQLTALKEFGARSDGKKAKKRVRAEASQLRGAVEGAIRLSTMRERVSKT